MWLELQLGWNSTDQVGGKTDVSGTVWKIQMLDDKLPYNLWWNCFHPYEKYLCLYHRQPKQQVSSRQTENYRLRFPIWWKIGVNYPTFSVYLPSQQTIQNNVLGEKVSSVLGVHEGTAGKQNRTYTQESSNSMDHLCCCIWWISNWSSFPRLALHISYMKEYCQRVLI